MPLHTGFLPLLEPFHLGARLHEELHFHLFELAHAEDELTGYNLIAESLAYLGNAKRNLHTAGLLHIEVVHKDALGCFGTEIHLVGSVTGRTHLSREHEVELTHIGPVLGTADRVYNAFIKDNLLEFLEVRTLHSLCVALMQGITLLQVLQYTWIGLTELGFVEGVAKLFLGLSHFLGHLLLILGYLVFDEHVGTIAFFGVAVINERVIESVHVAAGLPDGRVHKDG